MYSYFLDILFSPEVLLVPGVVTITVIPKLVLYLGHDDGPRHPRLGVPLEVGHLGQQLRQVDMGPVLNSEQGFIIFSVTKHSEQEQGFITFSGSQLLLPILFFLVQGVLV